MKKFRFKIFPERSLIIKYYEGIVENEDLYNYTIESSQHDDFSPNYNVLNDIRNCEFLVSSNTIKDFVNIVKNDKKLYDERTIVFLTKMPDQVVFSEKLNLFKNDFLISHHTCSTIEKAMNHLRIDYKDKKFIEQILFELRNMN